MEKMTDEDNFNHIADLIEAQLHGDVRILIDKDYKGEYHVEVQEIAEEGDEDDEGWENITSDGWFTINEKRGLKSYDAAAKWLEEQYL